MRSVLTNILLFLLTTSSRFELVWKLAFLSITTAVFAFYVRLAFGVPISVPPATYLSIVSLIACPFFFLGMGVARRMLDLQDELLRVANTDTLTGLLNRRAFLAAMEGVEEGAMLIVDADHFKAINDRYGHPAGDAVLVALADHLRRNFRAGDLIARIGGEEFAIYLVGADSSEIDTIGERVCKGFILCNDDVPAPIKVTMSIGAAFAAMSSDMLELTERADQALYEAKQSGRARLNFWQPASSGRS